MFEHEIEIRKPLSEVYAAFNNPENLPRWLTGLQRTEVISGTPGQVGCKTRQIYLERGKTVELIETITAHEPEKHMSGELAGPGMKMSMQVDFVDRGDRTLLKVRSAFRDKSLMLRLMMPFFKGSIAKRQTGDLRRFTEMVEAGELSG